MSLSQKFHRAKKATSGKSSNSAGPDVVETTTFKIEIEDSEGLPPIAEDKEITPPTASTQRKNGKPHSKPKDTLSDISAEHKGPCSCKNCTCKCCEDAKKQCGGGKPARKPFAADGTADDHVSGSALKNIVEESTLSVSYGKRPRPQDTSTSSLHPKTIQDKKATPSNATQQEHELTRSKQDQLKHEVGSDRTEVNVRVLTRSSTNLFDSQMNDMNTEHQDRSGLRTQSVDKRAQHEMAIHDKKTKPQGKGSESQESQAGVHDKTAPAKQESSDELAKRPPEKNGKEKTPTVQGKQAETHQQDKKTKTGNNGRNKSPGILSPGSTVPPSPSEDSAQKQPSLPEKKPEEKSKRLSKVASEPGLLKVKASIENTSHKKFSMTAADGQPGGSQISGPGNAPPKKSKSLPHDEGDRQGDSFQNDSDMTVNIRVVFTNSHGSATSLTSIIRAHVSENEKHLSQIRSETPKAIEDVPQTSRIKSKGAQDVPLKKAGQEVITVEVISEDSLTGNTKINATSSREGLGSEGFTALKTCLKSSASRDNALGSKKEFKASVEKTSLPSSGNKPFVEEKRSQERDFAKHGNTTLTWEKVEISVESEGQPMDSETGVSVEIEHRRAAGPSRNVCEPARSVESLIIGEMEALTSQLFDKVQQLKQKRQKSK